MFFERVELIQTNNITVYVHIHSKYENSIRGFLYRLINKFLKLKSI